jgi:phenylacetate-CoA ligase
MKHSASLREFALNMNTIHGIALSSALYAPVFFKQYRLIKKSQWWTKEQHQEYQLIQLKLLVKHAYTNVPYWRRLFYQLHLTPDSFKTLDDLSKIPLLTKEELRQNSNDFKASNYPESSFEPDSTSGSTGSPLTRYIERGRSEFLDFGFFKTLLDWAGLNLLSRRLCIYGNNVPYQPQIFRRSLIITPFTLFEQNIPYIFTLIRKINPEYILAFPSAVTLLSHYIQSRNENPFRQLKAVITVGETLFYWQNKLLQDVLDCPTYPFYHQTESVSSAASCGYSNGYHFFPERGITELLDNKGEPVTSERSRAEIIGTGFNNTNFPLFRYRTGDIAVYTKKECPCGRHYQYVIQIEGRTQEYIVANTGDTVPMTGMYATVPSYSTHIKEYQFSQRQPGELVLHIVRESGYTIDEEKRIIEALQRRIGLGFNITIEYIEIAKRNDRGKIIFLIK